MRVVIKPKKPSRLKVDEGDGRKPHRAEIAERLQKSVHRWLPLGRWTRNRLALGSALEVLTDRQIIPTNVSNC